MGPIGNTNLWVSSGEGLPDPTIATIEYNGDLIMANVDVRTTTLQDVCDAIIAYGVSKDVVIEASILGTAPNGYFAIIDHGNNPIKVTYNVSNTFFGLSPQEAAYYDSGEP